MMDNRVVVVGAGLGGLSAAIRLAHAGFDVTVVEQQTFAGGKAGSVQAEGFRFDTGPSLMTMPGVFAELFSSVGEDMAADLPLVRLSPICAYFYPDGKRLRSWAEPERFGEEIAAATVDRPESLALYLAHARRIHDVAAELFLSGSLHEAATYASPVFWRSLIRLPAIDALRSMHAANASFFRDPKTVQLFDRYATYNGSSPFRVPATLCLIPHVEYGLGAWAPRDGIVAIPRALERLARKKGVRFLLGTRVEEILHRDGEVTGVHAGGMDIEAPVVISNADVLSTYRGLLRDPSARLARRYERLEPSSSGLVFCWGVGRSFPQLLTHNIFFSSDYRREFDDIFSAARSPADPTIYVNITSKVTPSDAPQGGENWFVLVNAPHDAGQDWEAERRRTRETVLRRLSGGLGVDLEAEIRAEWNLTPPEIEARTGSTAGSLYGISSNSPLAAFLRHPNRSRRHRGLYFAGGSAHPGGGMPLAVLSGKIAAELVLRHEGRPAARPVRTRAPRAAALLGRDLVERRRDLRIAAVLALFFAVGFIGHLFPAIRPLMLAMTPVVLAVCGLVVTAVALRDGGWRVALWAIGTYVVTFALEAAGVATGAIFGPYGYGGSLGPKILDVPVVIGFNWMLVVLGGVNLAGIIGIGRAVGGRTDDDGPCPICVALAAGAACVVLDVPLEPVAARLDYWTFYTPTVPLQNYIAWFLIAALSAFSYSTQRCRVRTRLPAAYLLIQLAFFVGLALAG